MDDRKIGSWKLHSGNAKLVRCSHAFVAREVLAELYPEIQGVYNKLIDTAFIARNIISIVNAMDKDGLLRY